MHYFSPANVMRLSEVVRGAEASDAVIARCMTVANGIGEIPVLVGYCAAIVGSPMLRCYRCEAWFAPPTSMLSTCVAMASGMQWWVDALRRISRPVVEQQAAISCHRGVLGDRAVAGVHCRGFESG